ncbi:MAG: ribosome silencing factor [Eubacteriaceae bacterium]|jgi:ribosome-associated protein|nr:ribosome silencing factor [Eubacteriaceae bacterium]
MNFMQKAEMFASWAEEKKAEDIRIIDVSKLTAITDAFVILSVANERQLDGLADHIYLQAKENGLGIPSMEGKKASRWVLMDFGDVVIHLFHKEERAYYDIEKLWSDGECIFFPQREEAEK